MPKRKRIGEPAMWKVGNVHLFLLSNHQYASVEYQKLKEIHPNIRVCFIKNVVNRMQAIFAELSDPTPFPEVDDNYHIVEAREMSKDTKTITLGKYEVTWNGKNIKCLGSRICKQCFLQGKLFPRTCHEHLKCEHGRNKVRNCKSCVAGTLLGYWKQRTACFQGDRETLFMFSRCNNTTNSFKCDKCQHLFPTSAVNITTGRWCPFCSNTQLCDSETCQICFQKSFASHPKSVRWNKEKNNYILPRQVFRSSSKEYWFDCKICPHSFDLNLHDLSSKNVWCRYCAHFSLCGDEKCEMCFGNSFASHEKSEDWHSTKNYPLVPRQVFLKSHDKRSFCCKVCCHDFEMTLYNIWSEQWCPFCAHKKLCDDLACHFCFNNSFASQKKSEDWHPTKNFPLIPRQLFITAHIMCWFFCRKCNHDFDILLSGVSQDEWCPFCAWKRRCGKYTCKTCAQSCDVCKTRKAQTKTQISRVWVCFPCLADALLRDPNEKPIIQQAKISLEIYTLAELLRQSDPGLFIETPTAWDCAVLPGLGFRPDIIWCFDEYGVVIQLGNVNKLNLNIIRYALQMEIMEGSRMSHSLARSIPDEDREVEIRGLFASQNIPFGLLNVTIAHTKHIGANPDDVFFIKPAQDQEYHVIQNKITEWISRVINVRDILLKMFEERSNETICIGS
jgi:hypothetical protein